MSSASSSKPCAFMRSAKCCYCISCNSHIPSSAFDGKNATHINASNKRDVYKRQRQCHVVFKMDFLVFFEYGFTVVVQFNYQACLLYTSILNISLSIGNHLNAFSSRVFNRDISLSLSLIHISDRYLAMRLAI